MALALSDDADAVLAAAEALADAALSEVVADEAALDAAADAALAETAAEDAESVAALAESLAELEAVPPEQPTAATSASAHADATTAVLNVRFVFMLSPSLRQCGYGTTASKGKKPD